MKQPPRAPTECTPEKKAEFKSLRSEFRYWLKLLKILESKENGYHSRETYEENHRVISLVLDDIHEKALKILNS